MLQYNKRHTLRLKQRLKFTQKVPLVETEQHAAQEQTDNFVIDSDDHASEQVASTEPTTESAPVENEVIEAKEPTDNFQTRINKVTADKYAEKRRADELQRKLDSLQAKPQVEAEKPTLEGFDHDEDAYINANVSYQVKQELNKQRAEGAELTRQANLQREAEAFDARIEKFGKDDFDDKANAVPALPDGVADALMNADNGAELIYHLGEHLDVADAIANMSPANAMMELGRISANMSATKTIKPSAAPEPIETLNASSVVSNERGPSGATYE